MDKVGTEFEVVVKASRDALARTVATGGRFRQLGGGHRLDFDINEFAGELPEHPAFRVGGRFSAEDIIDLFRRVGVQPDSVVMKTLEINQEYAAGAVHFTLSLIGYR